VPPRICSHWQHLCDSSGKRCASRQTDASTLSTMVCAVSWVRLCSRLCHPHGCSAPSWATAKLIGCQSARKSSMGCSTCRHGSAGQVHWLRRGRGCEVAASPPNEGHGDRSSTATSTKGASRATPTRLPIIDVLQELTAVKEERHKRYGLAHKEMRDASAVSRADAAKQQHRKDRHSTHPHHSSPSTLCKIPPLAHRPHFTLSSRLPHLGNMPLQPRRPFGGGHHLWVGVGDQVKAARADNLDPHHRARRERL